MTNANDESSATSPTKGNSIDSEVKSDNIYSIKQELFSDIQKEGDDLKIIQFTSSKYRPGAICKICSRNLKSMKYLERHQRTMHAVTLFSCSECDKKFDNKRKMTHHQRCHRPKQCPKCDKNISVGNISQHTNICQGSLKVLQCDKCEYQTKLAQYISWSNLTST